MQHQSSKLIKLASTGIAGVALANSLTAATVLDSVTGLGNTQGVPETYGSNLPGTPNIALDWGDGTIGSGWDSYANWNGRGEVIQTDYNNLNPMSVEFIPDSALIGVWITSFDLDEWAGGGDSSVSWFIKNGASIIVSGTWDDKNAANDPGDFGDRTPVNTGMTEAMAIANAGDTLTLELSLGGGNGSYQAMDNLAFDQVTVPEPTTGILGALGLGALALRRRRK